MTQLFNAADSDAVLRIVDDGLDGFKAREVATALHRVAARNKKKRARRDVLLRDARLERLIGAAVEKAPNFSARCVADVLWSMATLQHFPSPMLLPVLTSVNEHLEKEDFEGQHLCTIVWSFARLTTKPTRLLERIEQQAIPRLGEMDDQNCAMLLWGFAKLGYRPTTLLAPLAGRLLEPGMLDVAKHVEVADIGFALGVIARPGECPELLQALALRAAPDTTLRSLSSRQICELIDTFAQLEATESLPAGLLDAWIDIVKIAHSERPLLARDAASLERSLGRLGVDAQWIKKSEMLSTWLEQMAGREGKGAAPKYSDEELRAVFDAIDTDRSGKIDLTKLKVAIGKVNAQVDDASLQRMIAFGATSDELYVSFDSFRRIMSGAAAESKQVAIV